MLRRWIRDTHWPLVFSCLGLVAFGTIFISSAASHDSGNYMARHLIWTSLGFVSLLVVPFIGYRTFLSISYLLYAMALVLLLGVLLVGEARMGAQRWIHWGPIALQPSEFCKLATVLALAHFLGSHHPWENQGRRIAAAMALILAPLLLIVKQPDLGTALLFLPIFAVVLFLWGIRIRVLVMAGLAGLVGAPLFWNFLKDYQKQRILVFLDPSRDPLGSGYTAIQSKIAVGSGGLFGKGLLQGTQSQLQFVPEHHTDFIFCVIGEEWGYAGALWLLVLYGMLFRAGFYVMSQTTDLKARLMIAGILAFLFSQVFINIGMSFGLMPITGLTLPLVSYGGSSLVVTSLALGLILSVYKERSIF